MTRRLIEIRSYRLKPGAIDAFHQLVDSTTVPMARAFGMDVVGYGRSLGAPDRYFLIRAYESPDHLQASEDAFYGSDVWRNGPRAAIVEAILEDIDAVFWLESDAIEAMRATFQT